MNLQNLINRANHYKALEDLKRHLNPSVTTERVEAYLELVKSFKATTHTFLNEIDKDYEATEDDMIMTGLENLAYTITQLERKMDETIEQLPYDISQFKEDLE